jgi:hypothetical protein
MPHSRIGLRPCGWQCQIQLPRDNPRPVELTDAEIAQIREDAHDWKDRPGSRRKARAALCEVFWRALVDGELSAAPPGRH